MVTTALAVALSIAFSGGRYEVVPEKSEIRYQIRHPLHLVVGTSKALAGSFVVDAEGQPGKAPISVKVPIASFSSKNRNRDSNVQTVLGVRSYPDAEAVVRSVKLESTFDGFKGTLYGTLLLHGVERPLTAPIHVVKGTHEMTIETAFSFSLDGHKVERPSLFLIPVDDKVDITCKLVARKTD